MWTTQVNVNVTVCITEIRRNLRYCRDYILIGNFLIMIFLPLLLLSILNGHIYHVLAKSSRRSISMKSGRRSINTESSRKTISNKSNRFKRDQSIATILITIVVIFGCCNIPRVTINLCEVWSVKNYCTITSFTIVWVCLQFLCYSISMMYCLRTFQSHLGSQIST